MTLINEYNTMNTKRTIVKPCMALMNTKRTIVKPCMTLMNTKNYC